MAKKEYSIPEVKLVDVAPFEMISISGGGNGDPPELPDDEL